MNRDENEITQSQWWQHVTKCPKCLSENEAALREIDHLLRKLEHWKDQAALWKGIVDKEYRKTWLQRLLGW